MDRHAEGAGEGERRKAMLLGFRSGGTIGGGRAYPRKDGAGKPIGEAGHKAVEGARDLFVGYRR